MPFLRPAASTLTAAAIAACALPTALAFFRSSSSPSFLFPESIKPSTLSSQSFLFSTQNSLGFIRNFVHPSSVLPMEAPTSETKFSSQNDTGLPELLTEYMVDMKCVDCVNAVKNTLQSINGVKSVDVDLRNQVVRIQGVTPLKTMAEALEHTGRRARLIGQGIPEDFLVSAAVAEFKGPDILGVVRLAQVNMELARVEAEFSGLSPGKHGWSINQFGDLTRGAASTGKMFAPPDASPAYQPLGDLGTLDADENGNAFFSGVKPKLRVSDLIGRSIVVYRTEDKSDAGLAAAVIARSAGVGDNYKKLCTCDGTTIWESSNTDFISSKV